MCVCVFPVSGGVDMLFITAYDFSVKRITELANRNNLFIKLEIYISFSRVVGLLESFPGVSG